MSIETNAWNHAESFRCWQGSPDMSEDEAALRDAAALAAEAADLLAIRAHNAHANGMTWAQVAEILGITRQSASARFTNPVIKGRKP